MSHSQYIWPFRFVRRQFSIVVLYDIIITRSQGQ